MTAQGSGKGLPGGDGSEEGNMGWRADMSGGGTEDRAERLEFTGEEVEGSCFAAGADEGRDARADGEQFSKFHMAVLHGRLVV